MTEEIGLGAIFNLKVELVTVYLPDSDTDIEVRRPGQKEIEEVLADYKEVAGKNNSDHRFACFILKTFWDSDLVQGKSLEDIETDMTELKDNDVEAITDWFLSLTRAGKTFLESIHSGDADFRSPKQKEV